MISRLKDKNLTIVTVETSSPVRQLLTDVMRSTGYDKVQGISSSKDLLSLLEIESVDWIIMPLFADQNVNAFHVLKLTTEYKHLSNTRVSIFFEEHEMEYLVDAFEQGMLNYFEKPFNKDSFSKAVQNTFEGLEKFDWHEATYSGFVLQQHFMSQKKWELAYKMSKVLLEKSIGQFDLMLNYAEILKNISREDEAKNVLYQTLLLYEDKKTLIEEKQKILFGSDKLEQKSGTNILNLNMCLIVDSDDAIRQQLKSILGELGCTNVAEFANGEEAWDWFDKQGETLPDIIFQEWAIPKLTGPYFVQRIRSKSSIVPIVVISSLVNEEDVPLLYEMGVASRINKPFTKKILTQTIINLIRQERSPTEVDTLERKIRQSFAANKYEEAKQLFEIYKSNPKVTETRKLKIEAELLFYDKNYEDAKVKAFGALKQSNDLLMILNLLGKILMNLRDFPAALKCFDKAQTISPKNLERLCMIAELQAEQKLPLESEQTIEKAKRLDKDNKDVKEGEVKVAIVNGKTEKAKNLIEKLGVPADLIAYMNNKAISYARCGFYKEGIDEYLKTIASIPDSRKELSAIVWYNLALAQLRQEEQDEALECLEACLRLGQSKVMNKAKSLISKIEKAMKNNSVVKLSKSDSAASDASVENKVEVQAKTIQQLEVGQKNRELVAKVVITPGNHCLFGLFENNENRHVKVMEWLQNMPHFVIRDIIERNETMGADKILKAAAG